MLILIISWWPHLENVDLWCAERVPGDDVFDALRREAEKGGVHDDFCGVPVHERVAGGEQRLQGVHRSHVVNQADVPDAQHRPQVVGDRRLQVHEAVLVRQACDYRGFDAFSRDFCESSS